MAEGEAQLTYPPCMGHIRHASQPTQNTRKLLEVDDRNGDQYVGGTGVPVGGCRHSLNTEPFQCQDICHVPYETAAIEGGHRDLQRGPLPRPKSIQP